MLYPLLWMLSASVRPEAEIFTSPSIWPSEFSLDAYRRGWNGLQVSFGTFFWNSFVIAALSVIGNVLSCSLAAFAFARLKFRGRNFWFAIMLGTLMIPYHVTLIPQYVLFLNLGWVDTFLPLVVPKFLAFDAFFIFLMVQFFRGIPRELDEAAMMDGCSRLADLLEDHAAAVDAGAGDRRDLLLHLDLGRLLRAADLPQRHAELHRPARPALVRRLARASPTGAACSRCRRCRWSRCSSSSCSSSGC